MMMNTNLSELGLLNTASYQQKREQPNHSLERTRAARRDNVNESWPGRSARNRWSASQSQRVAVG
jgi:hypothetical protein